MGMGVLLRNETAGVSASLCGDEMLGPGFRMECVSAVTVWFFTGYPRYPRYRGIEIYEVNWQSRVASGTWRVGLRLATP